MGLLLLRISPEDSVGCDFGIVSSGLRLDVSADRQLSDVVDELIHRNL